MTEPFTIALTPAGHLLLRTAEPHEAAPGPGPASRIRSAFERGHAPGLLHLGAAEARTALPPVFAFWRDFGRAFVAALCALPDLEEQRERADPAPHEGELDRLAAAAPPMPGGEYLTAGVLQSLWQSVLGAWRVEIAATTGNVQEWLASKDPAWSVVGRVHLHLAENRRDPDRPFAFLATYTTGLAASGKPQHRPLGEAVREASSAADRRRLLALLRPVHRASEPSALVKALADSGRLFQPQAWTPGEAHRFLREVPALEESGVVVRVPDWWSGRRAPRPRVTVSVGEKKPAGLGLDAVLDFDVRLTLGDEEITEAELRRLREAAARWKVVRRECAGQIGTVVELLAGKFSSAVMEVLCHGQKGLFPGTREIAMSCSCPDGAWLCKHLAAVLYGVGARLDHEPELLFTHRGVDGAELVAAAGKPGALANAAPADGAIGKEHLAEIFGIEMEAAAPAATASATGRPRHGTKQPARRRSPATAGGGTRKQTPKAKRARVAVDLVDPPDALHPRHAVVSHRLGVPDDLGPRLRLRPAGGSEFLAPSRGAARSAARDPRRAGSAALSVSFDCASRTQHRPDWRPRSLTPATAGARVTVAPEPPRPTPGAPRRARGTSRWSPRRAGRCCACCARAPGRWPRARRSSRSAIRTSSRRWWTCSPSTRCACAPARARLTDRVVLHPSDRISDGSRLAVE